jgi:hypothetical protein
VHGARHLGERVEELHSIAEASEFIASSMSDEP